jgi:hypothetical protein
VAGQERRAPTPAELRAFALGQLDPQRHHEVEAHLSEHPECLDVVEATPDDEVVRHLRGAGALPKPRARPALLQLAIEAVIPVLGGCAGVLVGDAAVGLAGVVAGQVAEKAINFFGPRIVDRWLGWLRHQPAGMQAAALSELAGLTPEGARAEVVAVLAELAPRASLADRQVATDYLSAIPRSLRRSLLSDRERGGRQFLPTISTADPLCLLQLLPADVPPYPTPTTLPDTDYQLEELIGSGGFGAVYRASSPSLQYLPLAIKFCLNRSLLPALQQERANLERLMKAGGESWSERIVRLYGYDLEHRTPYLVYEHVAGGDLARWLLACQARTGRGLTPAEVRELIVQVAEALAFAHQRGLVHRDLKPANVLMADGTVKLADFGIGGLLARQAVQASRIGTVAASQLSPAEQSSLFRGAGTPLYMAPEQRRGAAPDPRHDLYSLGVMWYQLLVGDATREMTHGWARELEVKFAVPRQQIELIERCVGWIEERPRDAGELLELLRSGGEEAPYRHLRLANRLAQLWLWHQRLKGATPLGANLALLGLCVGSLLGLMGSWLLGMAVGLGLLVLGVVVMAILKLHCKQTVAAKIKEVLAEFPKECQTWGGRSALAEQFLLEGVIRTMAKKAQEGGGSLVAAREILDGVCRKMDARRRVKAAQPE